ncbi:hypothetical protein C4D60_Mb06t02270 [Musa balbisiana]|uniref:Uncharacterized protein n=1 Tax=Musa balbisiana TaxID=52838 RepID=A0A4V4H3L6_MUSBA|nr:hypothetical protein C4D60_Mb06t02270 [Musa balbisiana]
MANLVKEEKKNDKIIRGLLKLPANRRGHNMCAQISGPLSVQTVAEYSKVDSFAVILSSSNIDRLRDFIKNVYVYRRYTGESVGDRPQKMKDKRDNYNENQKAESYKSGLRSPSYEDGYSPSYGGRNSDRIFRYNYGERSPGYDQGKYKRSPAYFEVVDDRRRDNKVGNVRQNRRLEAPRFLDAPKPEGKSPDHQKNDDKSSDPVVNQAKDTSVDDIPPLKIGETAISKETMVPDDSTQMETTLLEGQPNRASTGAGSARINSNLSSSSICSAEANSVQSKGSYFESLMDLIVDPNLPVATTEEQAVPQQTTSDTDDGGNSSASDISGQQKVSQVDPDANPLVSVLGQLSVSEPAAKENISTVSVSGIDSSPKASGGENLPTIQQEQLSLLQSTGSPSNQPSNVPAVGTSNDQTSMSSVAPYEQGSFTAASINPSGHLPQITTKSSQETNAGISTQPPSAGSTHGGMKELPVDLFTSLYPTTPLSAPGWQRGPYPVLISDTSASVITKHDFSTRFNSNFQFWSPFPTMESLRTLALCNKCLSSNQGRLGPDNRGADCGTSGIDQHPAISYAQASTPNSVNPVGGNPFG